MRVSTVCRNKNDLQVFVFMKKFLIFLLGFILGAVTLIIVLFAIGQNQKDVVMFESPGERVEVKSFRVIQVLDDGSALAMGYGRLDLIVMLAEREGVYYYDSEVVELPKGYCWRKTGIYKYTSNDGRERTVPVVAMFNK